MILQFYSDEFQSDAAFIFNFVSSTNAAKVYHKFEMRNKRSKCWIWWNSRVLVEMKRHGWARKVVFIWFSRWSAMIRIWMIITVLWGIRIRIWICDDQNLDDHYCALAAECCEEWGICGNRGDQCGRQGHSIASNRQNQIWSNSIKKKHSLTFCYRIVISLILKAALNWTPVTFDRRCPLCCRQIEGAAYWLKH